jgi:germination protein M
MQKKLCLFLVFGILFTMFTGCSFKSEEANSDELTPASSLTMGEDEAGGLKDKTPVQLYFINAEDTKLSAETRYVSTADAGKGSEYLATVVLKELISGPAKGSLLKASVPKETKVHSNVTIKDGVATVDLSKEFISKHPGGKKNEQLTLYSIVNTLTEIKDIKSVQFRIDGKVTKEFKGSYKMDIQYPRATHLIDAQPQSSNTIQPDNQETAKDTSQPTKDGETKKTGSDVETDVEVNEEILE